MDFGDGIDDGLRNSPTPKPRPRILGSLPPLELLQVNEEEYSENRTPRKKKKKSHLSRLKDKSLSNGNNVQSTLDEFGSSQSKTVIEEDFGLSSRLDSLDIGGLPSLSDDVVDDSSQHNAFQFDEESPPPSSRKKKKKGGALSRLKERQANQNGSQTSLTSQEVLGVHADSAGDATGLTTSNIAEVLNEDEEVVSAAPQPTKITATYTFPDEDKLTGKTLTDSGNSFKISSGAGKITTGTESGQVNGAKGKQSLLGDDITNHSELKNGGGKGGFLDNIDMHGAVESEEEDTELIAANYQHLLSTSKSDTDRKSPANFPTSPSTSSFPAPKPSTKAPLTRANLLKAGGKSGSMPDISDSVRLSKRNWESIKSKIGLEGVQTLDDSTFRKSLSSVSLNTTASSGLHTVRISTARHKNFLVGQQSSHSSVMGASELDRTFPDRNINIFVGTWNTADLKNLDEGIEDFMLPKSIEYVPDLIVITTQENSFDRKQWELTLQETVGPNHVIYHSAQHGTLHMAVIMKRELIWFCSVAEEDTVTVRAFKQIKTKGAVAVSFTMFGTSMLFIGSHFKAHDGNIKARIQDYHTINNTLKLPRAVVENPLQTPEPKASLRFDSVFWAGDLNFRVTKNQEMVLQMIEAAKKHEHPHFEQLLEHEELTQAMNRGDVFEEFQEGQIRFPPSYKFDIGTDNYDSSRQLRIPSYTDRILFKSKRKHGIVCQVYDSAPLKSSDHKPVYGLYQVNLRPGRDSIPLSGGQFRRDIYVEAAKRRALRRVAENIKPPATGRSAVCSIQ